MPTDHYLILDAARGIAAIAVLFFHLQIFFLPKGPVYSSFGDTFLQKGFLAVDLFFLMSGFVIAHAYEVKLHARTMSFAAFCRIRFIRLWPLYALGMVLGFLYAWGRTLIVPGTLFDLTEKVPALFINLLFLPAPNTGFTKLYGLFPWNAVSWSLCLEVLINLVYAAGVYRLSTRALSIIALIAATLFAVTSLTLDQANMGWDWSTLHGGLCRVTFSFTLGVIFWRLLPRITLRLPACSGPLLLLLICLTLTTPVGKLGLYYDLACVLVVFPLFVLGACLSVTPPACARLFQELGRISYPLYALQYPFLFWLSGAFALVYHRQPASLTEGLALVATILLGSYLTAIVIDEPLRGQLRKRFSRE